MIIQIKTLQNNKYDLEVDLNDTVAQIKERIHNELDLGEPENQKLIHRGKILKDDQTAQSIGLKEKDFVVVMVKKGKSKKADETESTNTEETTTSSTPLTTTTSQTTSTTPTTSSTSSTSSSSSTSTSTSTPTSTSATNEQAAASSLVTGAELQSTVQDLMNMGFDREQVLRALRAAYNNPDRAVEYLLNGMPNEAEQPPPPTQTQRRSSIPSQSHTTQQPTQTQTQSRSRPQQQQSSQQGSASGGAGGANPLAHFQQAIQNNPQLLAGLIAQLAQQNPQLMQAIQQNPAALQQVLQDPQIMQQLMGMMLLQQLQQGGGNGGGDEDGDDNPLPAMGGRNPPPGMIQVTTAEKEAIDRLKILVGCSEAQAVEAFMVCDKNEELAANYLLEGVLGGSAFLTRPNTSSQPQSQSQTDTSSQNQSQNQSSSTGDKNETDTTQNTDNQDKTQ